MFLPAGVSSDMAAVACGSDSNSISRGRLSGGGLEARRESRGTENKLTVEIRTKSVEQTLVPLVTQVS